MSIVKIANGTPAGKQPGLFDGVALRRSAHRSALAAMISAERIIGSIGLVTSAVCGVAGTLLAVSGAVVDACMAAAERVADALIAWVDLTLQRHGRHG